MANEWITYLCFALETFVSFNLIYLRGKPWYFLWIFPHVYFCTLMFLATKPNTSHVFPIASSIPMDITSMLAVTRLFTVREPHVRSVTLQLLRQPDSSHTVRGWIRFVLQIIRGCFLIISTAHILKALKADAFTYHYLQVRSYVAVLSSCLVEFRVSSTDMDSDSYLPLCEFGAAFQWQSFFADGAASMSRIEVLALMVIVELSAWFIVALPVLCSRWSKHYYVGRKLPSPFKGRFRHFIVAQLLIETFYRREPQTYANRTIIVSVLIGFFHIAFKSSSISHGGGSIYTMMLQRNASRCVTKPEPLYRAGIISVDVIRDFEDLYAKNAVERLRKIPRYVPSDYHRVAALSYKHYLPYVDGGMRVKISPSDLARAIALLEQRGITHVWIDFVQNARTGDGPRRATWFEEGVAPFINHEVIALWSREQAGDSMWLRLEEMGGLLGKGFYHDIEGSWTRGLGLSEQLAILQLGARASVGELAGCRPSYTNDVDDIARSYGKALVASLYGMPSLWSIRVPDDKDFVYRSQVTLNMLIALPPELTETNMTVAEDGLAFVIGRQWGPNATVDGEHGRKLQLDERYRHLRVLSTRSAHADSRDGDAEEFNVICEARSFMGTTFRVFAKAKIDEDGNVRVMRHRWLGERKVSLNGFRQVERAEWIKWR